MPRNQSRSGSKESLSSASMDPSMELLLLRDEERRAALAKRNRKQKPTTGMNRYEQYHETRAQMERIVTVQPESLRALRDLEFEDRTNESGGPQGDSANMAREGTTNKTLPEIKLEQLAQIDNEVQDLQLAFARLRSMMHLTFAGLMFLMSGFMVYSVYNSLYEIPQPIKPEEYRGIWNLWGIFS